jgi:hypothetical protein
VKIALDPSGGTSIHAYVGLAAGPLLFAAMLLSAPPAGMAVIAWRTAAVGVLMATWWITEAIPIAATALLPIVLFPMLGVAAVAATTAPYGNPVIYLFLGGFLIAMALEGCGLHRRVALAVLGVVAERVLHRAAATGGVLLCGAGVRSPVNRLAIHDQAQRPPLEGGLRAAATATPAWRRSARREPADLGREFDEDALGEIQALHQQVAKRLRVGAGDLAPQRGQVVVQETVQVVGFLVRQLELHGALRGSLCDSPHQQVVPAEPSRTSGNTRRGVREFLQWRPAGSVVIAMDRDDGT